MEQQKKRRYQGGKVRQIRQDYTGLITLLVLLLLVAGLMIGCVIARKTAENDPPTTSEIADTSKKATSSGEADTSSPEPEKNWENLALTESNLKKGDLILVNRNFSYDSVNADCVTTVRSGRMTEIQENEWGIPIGDTMLAALESMQSGMMQEMNDRMVFLVNAGFRTAEDQQKLIDYYTEENGKEYVDTYVAPVGGSEHHTMLAADISFYDLAKGKVHATTSDNTAAHYSWVLANCQNYGLILRYTVDKQEVTGYGAESWHFRYVGIPHATYMNANGLALEEYIEEVKKYSFSERLTVENGEQAWEIYYVAKDPNAAETQVPVPKNASYQVSGNNCDGFIVTVKVK